MMVKNNLQIKKELFMHFPELNKWLGPYIPPEKFDEYILYRRVDVERRKNVEIIRGAFTFYTVNFVYSFPLTRPNEKNSGGWILPVMAEVRDKFLEFDQFFEGDFCEIDFNAAMEEVRKREGIKFKNLFFTHLVELDFVNLDLDEEDDMF